MAWLDRFFTGGLSKIQIAGVDLAPEATINFASGASGVDSPGNKRSDITIPGGNPTLGGDLSGLALTAVVAAITGAAGAVPVRNPLKGDSASLVPFTLKPQTISLSADANHTLTSSEYETPILKFTSSVTLTATRTMQLPNVTGGVFWVENSTTGGQSLLFKAASGTGITVANGTSAIVWFDGTNYVAESAVPGGGAGGDLSGTYPNPTVAKVNAVTYGAGGALVTGQIPRVTGVSTTAYGALDLANANATTGTLAKTKIDPSYTIQIGTDGAVTANANSLVLMPTLTAGRTVSLPAAPADGNFVGIWATNGVSFNVTVSGNGHNINNGFDAAASTDVLTNDGQISWYTYDATATEWKIYSGRTPYRAPLYRSPTTLFTPTALYTLDGVLTDSGGSSRDLANLAGNTQYGVVEARRLGLACNGSTAVRRTTRTSALDSVSSLSISFTIRPALDGSGTRKWAVYYGNTAALAGTSANDECLYAIAWEQPATGAAAGFGVITMAWENSAGTDFTARSTFLLPVHRTTHVTLVRTSGAHVLFYYDGVLQEDINVGTLPSAVGGAPTQVLTVGGDGTPTTSANFFTGAVHGLKIIVGTELTAAQAFQTYARQAGVYL